MFICGERQVFVLAYSSTIIQLMFSVSPNVAALLLVVLTYALDRLRAFESSSDLAAPYRRMLKLVLSSFLASVLSTVFSFVLLLESSLPSYEFLYYLMIISFWGSIILLVIASVQIVKKAL